MIDLGDYRIIDLSVELKPGVLRVNGEYTHGGERRRLEIRQFIYAHDRTFMHWVETESHIGTHVEMPAHYIDGGRSSSEMPIETFIGEALVLKFDFLKPINGSGQPIRPDHLGGVKEGDILLMWSPFRRDEMPYISSDASRFMVERNIKMLGVQNIRVEESYEEMATHKNLLMNDIPIIENLVNLEEVSKSRVFFIGLPIKIRGLDSSWIRAVALEEK